MRYKRLKDKIEEAMGSGGAAAAASNPPATPAKATKKAAGPRKRKASPIKDEEDEDDIKPSQLDGASEQGASRRQTRGKKLNFDLLATFTSDEDMGLDSFENGDTEYVARTATMKSDDDDDESFSESEGSIQPDVKRVKNNQPAGALCETARSLFPSPSKSVKHGSRPFPKTTAPEGGKELVSKLSAPFKSAIEATMPTSQKPLPSIEFSPSPPTTCTIKSCSKKQQSVADGDSDVETLRLAPGTVLSFPAKLQIQPSRFVTPEPLISPTQSSSSATFYSAQSSSHDSAGRMLKQNLREHASQLEIRPEDSVSNIGTGTQDEETETPVTPNGKRFMISSLHRIPPLSDC